jgi:hypothetical protein
MLWDGAYQFCCSLVADKPFAYLSRFHSGVVWQPMVWLAHGTDNLRVLKMAYGAPFCLAPLAGALLSWWIVRRQAPHLMLWALFGVAIAPLPGQIFMVNDSIFQVHFWWPVFFATFLPVSRVQLGVILLVSLLQLSHPIGIGICGLCAVAALAFARWGTPERRSALLGWAGWHAALAIGGIVKLKIWPDLYAAQEASLPKVLETFAGGVIPCAPGLLAAWTAAALFLWMRAQPESQRARSCARAALPLLALTGITWGCWASLPLLWQAAINYRRWVFPMSMPFLLAAGWELWHRARLAKPDAPAVQRRRDWAGVGVACIFFLVLGLQSYGWSRQFQKLSDQVAVWRSVWIKEQDLEWTIFTPLDHWGIAAQVIVAQGRQPRVLFAGPGDEEKALETPARFSLSPWNQFAPETMPPRWFDWSVVLRETRKFPVSRP